MRVEIRELQTRVDVVDPEAMLSPQVLESIVAAVLARIAIRERAARARQSELKVESVVGQQRARGGG
jgi:hypothetical protein